MNIILWRHAEAELGSDDLRRGLTNHGQMQAGQIANWLQSKLPKNTHYIVSEAKRSQQTMAYLNKAYGINAKINPGADASAVLEILKSYGPDDTIVIVGHQPFLGRAISLLLTGHEADMMVKKGSLWWIGVKSRDGVEYKKLKVMMAPGMTSNK